jgi:hypothetical protein
LTGLLGGPEHARDGGRFSVRIFVCVVLFYGALFAVTLLDDRLQRVIQLVGTPIFLWWLYSGRGAGGWDKLDQSM